MKQMSFLIVLFFVGLTTGCGQKNTDVSTEETYQTISAVTAKEMMDENKNLIILDVRTLEEYNAAHIEHAILLPNTKIVEKAESMLPDKDAIILVYCRSGSRSASAAKELQSMGYTNIYDFGGIIDWIYDTVSE